MCSVETFPAPWMATPIVRLVFMDTSASEPQAGAVMQVGSGGPAPAFRGVEVHRGDGNPLAGGHLRQHLAPRSDDRRLPDRPQIAIPVARTPQVGAEVVDAVLQRPGH